MLSCNTTIRLIILLLIITAGNIRSQTAIVLDHVQGSFAPGTINAETEVGFYLRYQNFNQWQASLRGATNGFCVYSPDGASWQAIAADEQIDVGLYFDLMHTITLLSATGQGRDTACFTLARLSGSGFPYGFDQVTHRITTRVNGAFIGKTICLDSASYLGSSGQWLWAYGAEVGSLRPDWFGPYCFTVADIACCGRRGNIDHDPQQSIGIDDLVYLVNYMFNNGSPPPCPAEADCDGDGHQEATISDLVYLVNYMFNQGAEPVPCEADI
ncbi:MAG: hypothetical protein ABIE70_07005 [bacterium]